MTSSHDFFGIRTWPKLYANHIVAMLISGLRGVRKVHMKGDDPGNEDGDTEYMEMLSTLIDMPNVVSFR
jgi:hypothetical protein